MRTLDTLKKDLIRLVAMAALSLLLLPALTLGFGTCATGTLVRYDAAILPMGDVIGWGDVSNITYEDSMDSAIVQLTLAEKSLPGAKTRKIKVSGDSGHRESVVNALGQYWQRHKIAHTQT